MIESTDKFTVLIAVALCALPITTASAASDLMLTGVKGEAATPAGALATRGAVAEGDEVTTGEDGNVALLLDRNAVVELCGQSRVKFRRDPNAGNRVVNIESGSLRLIAEPREPGERIEIRTPAAIATILGTVVYVSVDPVTGATTISSSQSQVNVVPRGETEGTIISAAEQTTIVPGEAKAEKKKLTKKQVDELGHCLLDFHDLALEVDRLPLELAKVRDVVEVDIQSDPLPPVGSPTPEFDLPDDPTDDPLDPFDTNQEILPAMEDPPMEPPMDPPVEQPPVPPIDPPGPVVEQDPVPPVNPPGPGDF